MPEASLSQFADRINEIMLVFMKEFARRQASQFLKVKITLPQLFVLGILKKENELRMTDLAKFIGVTTAAMTGIVDRLIKYGYLKRQAGVEDRRIIKVSLTAKGAALVTKVNEQRKQMIMNTFGRLSSGDRQNYLDIILKIQDILLRQNNSHENI
jgi:DNA-binding MarR family transcriptional regulator